MMRRESRRCVGRAPSAITPPSPCVRHKDARSEPLACPARLSALFLGLVRLAGRKLQRGACALFSAEFMRAVDTPFRPICRCLGRQVVRDSWDRSTTAESPQVPASKIGHRPAQEAPLGSAAPPAQPRAPFWSAPHQNSTRALQLRRPACKASRSAVPRRRGRSTLMARRAASLAARCSLCLALLAATLTSGAAVPRSLLQRADGRTAGAAHAEAGRDVAVSPSGAVGTAGHRGTAEATAAAPVTGHAGAAGGGGGSSGKNSPGPAEHHATARRLKTAGQASQVVAGQDASSSTASRSLNSAATQFCSKQSEPLPPGCFVESAHHVKRTSCVSPCIISGGSDGESTCCCC